MSENKLLHGMGQRIMLRRKALKLTQDELAERIGVSTQMISNLELGKNAIRPENLVRVCEVLKMSSDMVLLGSERATKADKISGKLLGLSDDELDLLDGLIDYMLAEK